MSSAARSYQVISTTKFKGIHTSAPVESIESDEFEQLENLEFTNTGTLQSRKGFNRVTDSSDWSTTGVTLIGRQTVPGGNDYLYWASPSKLYRSFTSGAGMTEILLGGVSITDCKDVVQWVGNAAYVIRSTAAQHMFSVNTAGVTSVNANNIRGTAVVHFKARLFAINSLGVSGVETELYWSDVETAAVPLPVLATPNKMNVGSGDGQVNVALQVYNDQLWIFKERSIYVLAAEGSSSSWVLRKVHDSIGCIGRKTVKIIDGLMYFWTHDGIYRTDGTSFENLSEKINTSIVAPAVVQDMIDSHAVYFDNKYLLIPKRNSVVLPATIWVYDLTQEEFTSWTLDNLQPLGSYSFEGDNPYIMFGANNHVRPFRYNKYDDHFDTWTVGVNTPIGITIKTKKNDFGSPTAWKQHYWTGLELEGGQGAVILWHRDTELGGTGPVTVGNDEDYGQFQRVRARWKFRRAQMTLTYAEGDKFELFGIHEAVEPGSQVHYAH